MSAQFSDADDLPHRPITDQCTKDLCAVWKKHSKAVALSIFLAVGGAALCMGLKPAPRVRHNQPVKRSDVIEWASIPASLDRAAAECEGGGVVREIFFNTTAKGGEGTFEITCESPRLSRKAYVTLAVTVVTLIAMIKDQPPDLCMLVATLVLLLWPWTEGEGTGIISQTDAWQGFSNNGVLTVGVLFVVARAVDETGAVDMVMKRMLGAPRSLFWAQLRLLVPVCVFSVRFSTVNMTPVAWY